MEAGRRLTLPFRWLNCRSVPALRRSFWLDLFRGLETQRSIAGVRLCSKTRGSKSAKRDEALSAWRRGSRPGGCFFSISSQEWHRASAQTGNSVPTAETIIARMAQARAENRVRLRPYIVTRNYKLFGKDVSKAKSEVVADVAFVPPDSKKYTIQETNGSGLGQILVRRMLAGEAEVEKRSPRNRLVSGQL